MATSNNTDDLIRRKYVPIHDRAGVLHPSMSKIKAMMRMVGWHEVVEDAGGLAWLRVRSAPDVQFLHSIRHDCSSKILPVLSAVVGRQVNSEYEEAARSTGPALTRSQLEGRYEQLATESFSSASWYKAGVSLAFTAGHDLDYSLGNWINCCRRWSPNGCVHIFEDAKALFAHSRLAHIIRSVVDISVDELSADKDGLPRSLEGWHFASTMDCFGFLMQWLCTLCFPKIIGATANRFGVHAVLVFGSPIELATEVYRPDWLALLRSRADFGEAVQEFSWPTLSYSNPLMAYFQRAVWSEDTSSASELLEWTARRAGPTMWQLLNFGNSTTENGSVPGGRVIDLRRPWEQFHSFDRIVRQTLLVQAADPRRSLKRDVFHIVDLWADLFAAWTDRKPQEFWSFWLDSERAPVTAKRLLAELPAPWANRMVRVAQERYAELQTCVELSVWAKHRISDGKIEMRPIGQPPWKERIGEYTARLIQEIRNTVHGYVEKSDKQRARLILSDGSITDSVAFLPSLWLLMGLANLDEFLRAAVSE